MKKFLRCQKGIIYFSILTSMIPILFAGIGLSVYNQVATKNGIIAQASKKMSEQEKQIYNSSVFSYVGSNRKGVDVRSCIDAIILSNNNNVETPGKFIALTINGTTIGTPANQNNTAEEVEKCASQMASQKTMINNGKRYTIEARYEEALISEIVVNEE